MSLFLPCGSLEKEGIVSPFEFQSTPLINVPGHTTQRGIQMRVILETEREKEKGTHIHRREREGERYFENSFLLSETVCLDDLLDACQELEPTVFFRDVSMMKASLASLFPRVVVANVSHYLQSKELCVFDQV